jgi:lambda repressor-like predicted transcriptional regulator
VSPEQKVAQAAHTAAGARAGLEAAMREANDAGLSLRKIATAAGMSHESVRKIVSKA